MEEKQIQIPDVNADAEERDNYTLIQETPEDNLSGESGIAIRYSKDFNIVQANELLRSKQSDLTLMESKLIRLAVSQIMKGDKDLRTYKVNVSQLAEFLEVPKTNVYRSMQDINISLMQRVIFIRDKEVPDKKGKPNYKILHWLSSVEYKDGTLTYRLSDELKPYLIGLSEMFTLYSYDSIIKLPTNYSIRLFELLTSWVNIIIKGENTPAFPDISTDPDEIVLAIDYLRDFFDCNDKYKSAGDFVRNVIEVNLGFINQYTNLKVSFRKHKKGRSISHVIFKYENTWNNDPKAEEHNNQMLDTIRSIKVAENVHPTLSIGVGRDADSFEALFKNASVALEMALSRGGDQAVVKDKLNFEFYGGRSKATEKRTKVKSRVMANALAELIDEAKQVYVMGHSYADMDALGAAAGVCAIVRKRGKKCRIVIDTENNAAHPVLRRLQALPEYQGAFLSGDDAFLRVQPETLLVVVDTNRPGSVESEPLLDACNRVAVIDHHRRGSSYIDKMALNYHEPYASSASELVTELLQYLIEPGDLLKAESEALLAGIVLDTKNFTNRTGGRTFEAAAYLRRAGADTADVQRMFQSDLQSMISRYDIIRRAELYHGDIAIAALDQECDRVIAAKAADEMLTLQGVRASFVLYQKDDGIYISARSLGEINVQVLVETLGGGGNSTTAGGQCSGMTVTEAKTTLLRAIDKYFEE